MEIMVLRVLILLLLLLFLSDCEFLDFSVFEKFSFQFIWGVFPPFYSSVPACMRRVCVGAILYVGTSVPACMCTHALRDERLGSLNNMFFSHDSSSTNSLSKLGRNIRITRTNQHLRVRPKP